MSGYDSFMGTHLSANDVVPALRPGIDGTPPPGTGEELVSVGPMRLRGFELQLARMLDGRRTAADVVENARELGLPLNLDSLEDFIARLSSGGLLTVKERPPRLGDRWEPAARDLYRDALRSVREGEFDQAKVYLDSMLRLQPATSEAVRLKQWIDAHPDPHVVGRTFGDVYQRTVSGWADDRPTHIAAELRDNLRGTWWLPLGVLTALGFLLAYTMLPVSHRIFAAAELAPADELLVGAPADGTVDEVLVKAGDRVVAGTPLLRLDGSDLKAAYEEAVAKLEKLRAPLRAEVLKTPEGAGLGEALARAERAMAGAEGADAVAAERQLQLARAEIDARIPVNAPGAKEAMQAAQEVKVLQEQLAQRTVPAPGPGVVKRVPEEGEAVEAGQAVAELDGSGRMRVAISLPKEHADSVAVGTPVTLHIGAQTEHTRIDAVNGREVVVEVSNADGSLRPGPMGVQLDLPPSSLMQRARH